MFVVFALLLGIVADYAPSVHPRPPVGPRASACSP
ncbi:MAG: hypothetical protein QOH85_18 [Acidobacteriaceae bacterium]|jgi:hypothetical protein|nr:hypothetical protein [Acidobacteriaceae bacterium]